MRGKFELDARKKMFQYLRFASLQVRCCCKTDTIDSWNDCANLFLTTYKHVIPHSALEVANPDLTYDVLFVAVCEYNES